MAYTQDTYLLQASFTEAQIDALIAEGYKAYDRFAEAYLNYSNEGKKPATFTVYGGSYTMKNSEVPVVIDAATTNMTISSVLHDGTTYYADNTIFELTATDFINNGTLNISKAAEDESDNSVTFKSNATFTNNNSVSVSNAKFIIIDNGNVVNSGTGTFNLTDRAVFAATTVTNSGTFNLTDGAVFAATTVTNSGTIKLTDAGFGAVGDAVAAVVNTGAIYVYGKTTEIEGEFTGTGSINYMAGTSGEKKGAQKNKITGDNTINFLTQTDGNRRFFTASDFDVAGTEINIVGTSVSFSGNTTLTAGELNVTSYTNEAGTKTYPGAVKITSRTVGELIAKNVSLNIGDLNGQITLTDVAIEDSTISEKVLDENNASLVMKDEVSISGKNVFNADIANSGTLSIAGSEDVPTSLEGVQTLTNSGSGKVTIDGKAEVTVESIVNKNAGLITVSNGATLNAGSISNKQAGSYTQTIAVEDGTLTAGSVNTTGANFNVTGASKLEIGKDDEAAGLTGTITLDDATLSNSFVKGGAVNVAGTVTLSGENTLSDITAASALTLAKNASLNASSLTVDGGSITFGAGSTVTLTGDLVSINKALSISSATVSAKAITAEGKALTFISSNITADTITATSAQVRGNSTLKISDLGDTVMTIKSLNDTQTTKITNSTIDAGSVTTQNNVVFSGENKFDAISNDNNLTVAGSLTAKSITNGDNATFTVSDAGTKLNIGKFTGTITFADGATLGDSTFGANSVITATNFAIADEAAVTLTVGDETKLNANISSGTINLVSGFDAETVPEWDNYQLIAGTIGDDVTFTVDGKAADSITFGEGSDAKTYGLITLSTGLYLAENQTQETLYVSSEYAGKAAGTKINGHIVGYNAFGKLTEALAQDVANEIIVDNASVEAATADLLYGVPLTKSVTVKPKEGTSQTVTITLTGGNSDLCLTPIGANTVLTIEEGITLDLTTSTNKGKVWFVYNWDEKPRATDLGPLGSIVFKGSIINTNTTSSADAGSQFLGNVTLTETATIKQTNKNISFRSGASGDVNAVVTITGAGNDSTKPQIDVGNGTLEFTSGNVVTTNTYINGGKFQLSDAHWNSDCALSVDSTNTTWNIAGGIYSTGNGSSGFKDTITLKDGSLLQVATATIGGLVTMDLKDSDMNVTGAMTNSGKITLGTAPKQLLSSTPAAEPEYTSELNVGGDLTNKASIEAKDGSLVSVTGTLTNSGKILVLEVPMRRATSNGSSRTVTVTLKKENEVVGSATATVYDHQITGWAPADVAHRVTPGGDTVFAVFDFGDQAIADGEYDVVVADPGFTGDVATAPDGTLIDTSSFTTEFEYAAKATVANASIDLTSSTLTAGTIENSGAINVTGASSTLRAGTIQNSGTITVSDSTLEATVVDTSAATFTVGGNSVLNISGTGSSLTGTITLDNGASVKATIAKGGTLNVAADTTATLDAGTSVASAITNAGTLTLTSVTKTGKITNDGTVSGSASTVAGITNNVGSVTLIGKSFGSVSVKDGTVTLNPEDDDTKAIAVGSITNGTKAKTAEAIDGSFTANGNVTGTGAITNYAGSINVTGNLTLNENKTTFVRPAITNGSIYVSNAAAKIGVGSIKVAGDLTAGNIVNGIENGATEPADKSFITAASITADSITNYGTVGSQAEGKPYIATLTLEQRLYKVKEGGEYVQYTTTGALINKKYGEVFAGTLNAASIENEGGIDVGEIIITSEDGTFVNNAGAKVIAGTSIEANAITNDGYIQAGNEGTIEAAALTNGAYVATIEDGYIHAKDITAASIENNGKIVAEGAVTTTGDITNGTAATPEAAAVEGTINAGSIEAAGDIVNNAGSVTVSGKISGASISNAGSIGAGSIEVGKAAVGTTPAVAGNIDNSGTIGTSDASVTSIELNGGKLDNKANAEIYATTINAGTIINTGSISAVNVTAANVTTNAADATFTVGGTSTLNISTKLTGTITLADGANVTAMVKSGTLNVENGSIVSLVGKAGNTAAVTNLGELTIAGGVFGAVTNKQVVGETTVSGTLTVAAAANADAIQTGNFVNNADVNVNSAFTVKGNFTNSGTITIDASKFDLGDDNTVPVISVTGTLTNNGDIIVVNIPEGETRQVFVKNDGENKGVYLFGGVADMTELLVYSDLANDEYAPGESFSFAGHGYVYAVNAFTSANAITQIAEDTRVIHFVPQEEAYGNLNLNLSATQDLTVDMINATGKPATDTFNFNNLIIASEVTEPNDGDEGITAGSVKFANDVATGTNATVSIAAATAVFNKGADFSESKSVTIQEEADVTFGGAFSAKATTITDSKVDFEAAIISGKATVTNSTVGFSGAASFADAATFTNSTVGFAGATFTAANTTGKASVTFSGSDVVFAGDANFTNGEEEGAVNVAITNSAVNFGGKATVKGALTLSGSEVDFDGVSTVGGLLKLTSSTVTANAAITAGSTNLDKNSVLNLSTGAAMLGGLTTAAGSKINLKYNSNLSFTATAVNGTIDVDVTGLTATKNEAPATITGITVLSNLTISGTNASSEWAKYFAFDAEEKTLTLIKEATNVITATGNTNINKALNYHWTGSDDVEYYADNVVIEGGATSTLYLQGNGSYVTLDGEYTVGIYGGKEMTKTAADTGRRGEDLGGDINITIEDGSFSKVVVGGDRINTTDATTKYMNYYREADINLTINGGTFNNYVAAGMMYQGDYLKGYAEIENTNLTITGGTFNMNGTKGGVFGGNFATTKTGSVKTTVLGSSNVKIIAGEEDIVLNPTLYVGSYGSGAVGSTSLTFSGNQEEAETDLNFHAIWGGCNSDLIKKEKDALGNGTYEGSVVGKRTLSFTGFKGAIDCDSINCFSDVVVENSTATLSDKCDLSNVQNWSFDTSSTLVGAFKNDFKGDTFVFSGDVAEGIDSWNVFENVGDLKGTFGASNSFSSVKLFGETAEWDTAASAFASTNYTLSLQTVGEDEEARTNMVVAKKLV